MADPGAAYLFQVEIDGHDIGLWTECSGLSAQYEIEEYEEGGQNMFVHKLLGRLKYENIRLKRSVDQQSGRVASWFSSVHLSSLVRTTASIAVLNTDLEKVADWHLIDVVPVKWTGPTFKAGQNGLAEEELELAHHGFM
ncbi:MAG: phage tail protein [Nitriliruptorales bacterium]|nr:phage tail protein [Nitriliruptorales bacterium]